MRAVSPADRKRTRARDRQRQCRARQRAGEALYTIALPEAPLVEALLVERLTEAQALDHRQVERAITELIIDWIARWLRHGVTDGRPDRW
jgi:hypothetical protein